MYCVWLPTALHPSSRSSSHPSNQPSSEQQPYRSSAEESCALLFVRLKPSVNTILNPSAAAVSHIFRIQAPPNSDDVSESARAMRQCRQPLLRPALAPDAVLIWPLKITPQCSQSCIYFENETVVEHKNTEAPFLISKYKCKYLLFS